MKRDMDLIRILLQKAHECEDSYGLQEAPIIDSYSKQQVSYHIKLLHGADLIEACEDLTISQDGSDWTAVNLTWLGHDFSLGLS